MSRIISLMSLFLLILNVHGVASAAQNISSGIIHLSVNITTPTCTSVSGNNSLRLICNNVVTPYSRQIFPVNKNADGLNRNIQSVNMQYINDSHTLGLMSVTYK